MHVLGFTVFILGFVMAHPIMNPNSIYNTVEQYKLDCYKYYTTKYEEQLKEEPVVEPIKNVETVVLTPPGDLGILSIPSVGIRVGLYSDGNAFQNSGKASVQYYTQYGIKWIADHVNQDGFGNLKNLSIGSKVYINETEYTVVDNVYAADYYSNFSAWVSYIGDSRLLLQTCEGDGARLVRCE
jgi:sortase (surface protein transpeptidase)